jgi:RHS repeat-associated protein
MTSYAGPAVNAVNGQTGQNVQLSYTYDGEGLRQNKLAPAVESYAYDRAEGLPLVIEDGTTDYVTGPGGLPLEQVTVAGTVLYYHHDQLGSTRALTDQAGRVVATYAYDPYGNVVGAPPAVVNPFQYAGQYTDAESGLEYLRARYYDPVTGQFLSRDPMAAATRSVYGYTGDNPLNASDPSGIAAACTWDKPSDAANPICDVIAAVGAGIAGITALGIGIYDLVNSGPDPADLMALAQQLSSIITQYNLQVTQVLHSTVIKGNGIEIIISDDLQQYQVTKPQLGMPTQLPPDLPTSRRLKFVIATILAAIGQAQSSGHPLAAPSPGYIAPGAFRTRCY